MKKVNCYFAISRVCNLRCTYCYVPEYNKARQPNYDDRAIQAAERFADKVRREGLPIGHISLHGAEPTILSPEAFGKVVATFSELSGQMVRMQSNGTRLTADYLGRLLRVIGTPDRLFVGISMDGSANIHNPNRNKTWDVIMQNIREMKARGFRMGILAVITSLTLKHLREFEDWVGEMRRMTDGVTFKLGEHGIGLTEDEKDIFARWLCESGTVRNLQGFMPELCIQDGNDCWFFEFDIDGNCYSCNKHFDNKGVFASWFHESFEVILQKRKRLYGATPVSPECHDCALWTMCRSGCPLSREDGRSVDCRVKKVVHENLRLADATIEFNPGLETTFDRDSGRMILAYPNLRSLVREELRLTPEASQLVTLFLEHPDITIGDGLRRFSAMHPDLPEVVVTQDTLAFLKKLYEKTVVHSFW